MVSYLKIFQGSDKTTVTWTDNPIGNAFLRIFRKNLPRVIHKKVILKNFAKFTIKHLCQCICAIKLLAYSKQIYLKKRHYHRLLSQVFKRAFYWNNSTKIRLSFTAFSYFMKFQSIYIKNFREPSSLIFLYICSATQVTWAMKCSKMKSWKSTNNRYIHILEAAVCICSSK